MKVDLKIDLDLKGRGWADNDESGFYGLTVKSADEDASPDVTLTFNSHQWAQSQKFTVDGLELYRTLTTILRVNGVIT